jgi:hypothetical protein
MLVYEARAGEGNPFVNTNPKSNRNGSPIAPLAGPR